MKISTSAFSSGVLMEVFEHIQANGTYCDYLRDKSVFGLRRTVILISATL
jgi:hypothetical protein